MSYKVEVHGVNDPADHYVSNLLRFETKEEANDYGWDLYCRWSGMDAYRVVPSDDPVTHTFEDGHTMTIMRGA